MRYIQYISLLTYFHAVCTDVRSRIDLYRSGFDFIPANSVELLATYSSINSYFNCGILCNQNPQCRTFVYDTPMCELFESAVTTGSIVSSPSTTRLVGAVNYNGINVSSAYNKSCSYCYPDRYLVCTNGTCQCPSGTYYDNQGNCINQIYVNSTTTCQANNWCNQQLNLTCQCGQCQCPLQQFWKNKTCVPQLLAGKPCNTSSQCRNDLNLVCSRKNKTCTPMTVVTIPVMTGTLPSVFSYVDESLNTSGVEWWRGFDGDIYTYWNRLGSYNVLDYLFLTFNDTYLLNSLQLTVYGDQTHDPKTISVYTDENGTCFGQAFSFSNVSSFTTFPVKTFNTNTRPIATNHVLISIERWSTFQTYLFELTFFGGLY
ncbi:unnamed protein product [Adineta ricciae]|uniref:EGF-like domain-containing protein n=1 Tax=Adineta ricciae TaxID=249248 RepID=A0A815YA01_ADIRI|nr:unnamed protein product [Adineta ricciae]CAF1567955.1 unnamed protein product [Adineta ricciae]